MASTSSSLSLPIRPASSLQTSGLASSSSTTDYKIVQASWSKATELFNSTLTSDDKKKIDLKDYRGTQFSDLLSSADAAKSKVETSRYPWTKTLQRIFSQIDRYAIAGDIIAQYDTQHTAVLWGTFRFLLLFAVEEQKSSEKLSTALGSIAQIVFRAEEHAKLFATASNSTTDRVLQSLQDNLTSLYAEVLNFLVGATIFFQKRTLRRYLSAGFSSDTKFQAILDRIDRQERNVEKDKGLLESEARKKQQEYDNGVWLQHADFETDLQKMQEKHIPGTCRWFLEQEMYLHWRQALPMPTTTRFLWVQGKPGCGKSVLASQIVRDVRSIEGPIVLYVSCKTGQENKDTLQAVIRNLVFQMLERASQQHAYHQLVLSARMNEKTQFTQSTETLWTMLAHMLRENANIFCILDGLDECDDLRPDKEAFLARLANTVKTNCPNARLINVSQLGLDETTGSLSLWEDVQIKPSDISGDIEKLVSIRISTSGTLSKHPRSPELLEKLVTSADGMVLWAELMIEELERGHWDVTRVLEKPPRGLSAMYDAIISRITRNEVTIDRVQNVLRHVLASARPFRLEELALSIAVAEGLQQHDDYDERGDAISEGRALVLECSPLLSIMPDGTVQATHSSLVNYLLGPDSPSKQMGFSFKECDTQAQLASILIKYMSFQCFDADAELSQRTQPQHYLIEYASKWLVHHCTRTLGHSHIEMQLVDFFKKTQGWKWLRRLSLEYDISFGHLQLWQAEIKEWAELLSLPSDVLWSLSNFLLVLSQNQYAQHSSLPIEDSSRIASMQSLALIFWNQGQWSEAEKLEVQVLETRKRVLGTEHLATLLSMNNLASTFRSQGRWSEAEKLLVQVLETSKRVLGTEHPDTLRSMNNLALTFMDQGRWSEAEKLQVQALETRKRVLGTEHPDTLLSMNNLASTFRSQGRWSEAEKLQVQVLETSKRVLGAEHPNTLSSMNNLASIFMDQGRWSEAEKLQVQVLETRKRVLGTEHPDTLSSMNNLASTFQNQGRWSEAEKLQVQALETSKRVLGAEHPDTLRSMNNLAFTFKLQDRDDEAIGMIKTVVELRSKIIGVSHPDTINSLKALEVWTTVNT